MLRIKISRLSCLLKSNEEYGSTFSYLCSRLAHTDVPLPNFDEHRVKSLRDPHVPAKKYAARRRIASSISSFVAGVAGLYGFKSHLMHYIKYMSPSREILAVAQTEVNLSNVPEGKVSVVKWRGKPVFIYHRSQKTIEQERLVDLSLLRDPETDEQRVQQPRWLVVIGICTHLGCVPLAGAGMIPGGFYCPCHGSHYDAAGRVVKGPAPKNLEVPQYRFLNDKTILIG